jgi:hypothetical protein
MNKGLTDIVSIREQVTEHFVQEMLHSSPAKQERIIRLLLARMPRTMIDALYIAQNLYSVDTSNTTTVEQPAHTLTDFLHKEHHTTESE